MQIRNETLGRFSNRLRRKQYQLFVEEGVDKEIDSFYQKVQRIPILGADAFTKTISEKYLSEKAIDHEIVEHKRIIQKQRPNIEHVFKIVASYYQMKMTEVKTIRYKQKNIPRQIAIYLSITIAQASLNDVAEFLDNVSYSAVAKAFSRFNKSLENDSALEKQMEALQDILLCWRGLDTGGTKILPLLFDV